MKPCLIFLCQFGTRQGDLVDHVTCSRVQCIGQHGKLGHQTPAVKASKLQPVTLKSSSQEPVAFLETAHLCRNISLGRRVEGLRVYMGFQGCCWRIASCILGCLHELKDTSSIFCQIRGVYVAGVEIKGFRALEPESLAL